ncbi:MAG TPA: TldD/PmbA family protein [Vicinamibacterales bacterium]|nr:TldD/PmbA family protein [Vicinamibacterales bacterium]
MLTRDEALKLCEGVLAHAKSAGAEDATVSVQNSQESHARFADNRVTTSGRSDDISITATVWVERRRGAATGNDTSPGALRQLADEVVQIARVSPVHREYLPTLGPMTYAEERGFADSTANIDLNARAKILAAVLDACRAAKVTGAGFHSARASATATATANGNRRFFRSSEATMSVTARSADGTGSGYYAGDHFDLSRLDARKIAEAAVGKAVRSQDPRPIDPGTYPVILEPQAVADLIGSFTNAFDARTADEGRSAFSAKGGKTRLGEKMFNERINLYSDPMHAEMPATPSTSEGIPATRLSLIKGGVVENFEYPRFWAREQKREPSPGPVNYILESTDAPTPLPKMIESMERGLLISRFWYVRLVDARTIMLTGLTRDGLWWIEKGRIQYPVRNLRFNQSVLAMLAPRNLLAIGAPERRSPLMVPPLQLSAFTFTSISDAI